MQADIAQALVKSGVEVWIANHRSVDATLGYVLRLGALVGAGPKAEAYAAELAGHIAKVRAAALALPRRPKVYFEEWDDPQISAIRWVSELIGIAGGDDIFPERAAASLGRDRIVADPAEVIARAPDIIIGSWCGKKFRPEQVAARAGWQEIPAVRDGELHEVKSPIILQPGPAALTDGLDALHTIIARWAISRHRPPSSRRVRHGDKPHEPRAQAFLAARDFLLAIAATRSPRPASSAGRCWSEFNWALDHFDVAWREGNDAPGAVDRQRGRQRARSARSGRWPSGRTRSPTSCAGRACSAATASCSCSATSWRCGRPCWRPSSSAPCVIPATALLTPEDLRDRIERGRVRHVIAGSVDTAKFAALEGELHPHLRRRGAAGLERFDAAQAQPQSFAPDGTTRATDPLLLYFTSGTTSQAQARAAHPRRATRSGHLSTMYWIGLRARATCISTSPRPAGPSTLELLLRAVERGRDCVFIYNVRALRCRAAAATRSSATASPRCARRPRCGAC